MWGRDYLGGEMSISPFLLRIVHLVPTLINITVPPSGIPRYPQSRVPYYPDPTIYPTDKPSSAAPTPTAASTLDANNACEPPDALSSGLDSIMYFTAKRDTAGI